MATHFLQPHDSVIGQASTGPGEQVAEDTNQTEEEND